MINRNTDVLAREPASGSRPSLHDEVWVISRSSDPIATPDDEDPGSGSMWTEVEQRPVAVPLAHTDVKATIEGAVATVKVTQQFHNPYDGKIEAVYVFPLPDNAAVTEFVMVLGERRIRGIIREREEAEKLYAQARQQGYVTSLLTQDRPNLFTQAVANIEPGRGIDVVISYFHTLACADDWFEWVFPMVVGPRFNPPGTRSGVGAVARQKAGASGQRTEVSYLQPQERSGHDISLQVDLRPGMKVEETSCRSHLVDIEQPAPDHTRVRLNVADRIPNKDFVLRYRLAGDRLKSSLLTFRDEKGGFFTLTLVPPTAERVAPRQPVELIFVLDSSGSMSGLPLAQAKAAIARGLERLKPDDTFQIIDFSDRASQFGPEPLSATPHNVARGHRYLDAVRASGGTMMTHGLRAALEVAHDPRRLRFVCFLTDGYIGNEAQILRELHGRLGDSRIFSFGVGSSPNRYLLNAMARLGRGAVAYLGLRDDGAWVMDQFLNRISHAALTEIRIDWGEMDVKEVFPRRLPDLFPGRPLTVVGRFEGSGRKVVRVNGRVGPEQVQLELPVEIATPSESGAAFPVLWARGKIAALSDRAIHSSDPFLPGTIRRVALDYGLMSEYTAFVAVDSTGRTAGRTGTRVPVAVPVPEGVKYQTTVDE